MDTLVVGAWISLHDGCRVSYEVGGADAALLTVRGTGQPFEMHCQAEPLRQLIEMGSKALAELDALAIQEGVDQAARELAIGDQSSEAST
jgi:hypothetical protein